MGTLTSGRIVLTNTPDNVDGFGRHRVSGTTSVFESQSTFFNDPLIWDESSSYGTLSTYIHPSSTRSSNEKDGAYVAMKLSDQASHKLVRQTREYVPYQPGKTKLIELTGRLMSSSGSNHPTARIGSFDDADDKSTSTVYGSGHFFQFDGEVCSVAERHYVTSTPEQVDTIVAQTAWNIDRLDGGAVGPNPSGLTFDATAWTKSIIFVIDLQYLGVGRVRLGVGVNGAIHYVHAFSHDPTSGDAIINSYMRYAKLPIRYEITSHASVANTDIELRCMCSTVISEGGFVPIGRLFSNVMPVANAITPSSTTTFEPMILLRLKNDEPFCRGTAYVSHIDIINSSGGYVQYILAICKGTSMFTGAAPTFNDVNTARSCLEIGYGGYTAIDPTDSNVFVPSCGFCETRSTETFEFGNYGASPLINSGIAGTDSLTVVLAIREISGTPSIMGALTWHELE